MFSIRESLIILDIFYIFFNLYEYFIIHTHYIEIGTKFQLIRIKKKLIIIKNSGVLRECTIEFKLSSLINQSTLK